MRDRVWYMAVVLGVVGLVGGLGLAGVKQLTDPIIEKGNLERLIKPSLEKFFEPLGLDNDYIADRVSLDLGKDKMGRTRRLNVFKGKRGGVVVAVALQTASPGYGGDIEVMTAFDVEKKVILGVKAVTQKETKGLGARVSDDSESFITQWKGVGYEEGVALESHGGRIDAISGATISSTGFTAAVNKAVDMLKDRSGEILGDAGGEK